MPVYASRDDLRNRHDAAPWVDIDDVEFFQLGNDDRVADGEEPRGELPDALTAGREALLPTIRMPRSRRIVPTHPKERVVVLGGEAVWKSGNATVTLKRMQWIDVPEEGGVLTNGLVAPPGGHNTVVEAVRIAGHWKQALRTSIFSFGPGRPCDYHYHDGDEYWFVHRGHFTLRYRGEDIPFKPGMILAAGMGEEHGVVDPEEIFEGVGFATQLEGEGRDGHLWSHVHGAPVAARERG